MIAQRRIIVAGAGVAGLTAALALEAKGFSVTILERSAALSEVGAGLQLAPNATRLLNRLGVLNRLAPAAVRPEALDLRSGSSDRSLLRLPLGPMAERRWRAPYFVCHRADLQAALLAEAETRDNIALRLGAEVTQHIAGPEGVSVEINGSASAGEDAELFVAADGVWSKIAAARSGGSPRFSGYIAWRTTIAREILAEADGRGGSPLSGSVTAWLAPTGHLVAYPVKAGTMLNLVAVTPGQSPGEHWDTHGDAGALAAHFGGWHQRIRRLLGLGDAITFWPLFGMPEGPWRPQERVVLIGDAAHAMTPFAAQGAAMAIEDACALAAALAEPDTPAPTALARFEAARKPRIEAARRRGSLNRFAYHAAGPVAFARNTLFALRGSDRFVADLDWLYGYDGTGFSA